MVNHLDVWCTVLLYMWSVLRGCVLLMDHGTVCNCCMRVKRLHGVRGQTTRHQKTGLYTTHWPTLTILTQASCLRLQKTGLCATHWPHKTCRCDGPATHKIMRVTVLLCCNDGGISDNITIMRASWCCVRFWHKQGEGPRATRLQKSRTSTNMLMTV